MKMRATTFLLLLLFSFFTINPNSCRGLSTHFCQHHFQGNAHPLIESVMIMEFQVFWAKQTSLTQFLGWLGPKLSQIVPGQPSDGSKFGFNPNYYLINLNEHYFCVILGYALRVKNQVNAELIGPQVKKILVDTSWVHLATITSQCSPNLSLQVLKYFL